MIFLTTGQPGHGKTLLTIYDVQQIAKKENRPVFYSGITVNPDGPLKDWMEHDPLKWYELPPRSIMVIDECQKTFRPRGNGAQVPKHEEELETHRHGGIDLYLITQHPMFTSTHVRRLTHIHRHVIRVHGLQAANVHEWNAVRDDCDKPGRRDDSNCRKVVYPKEVYDWYKSAEVHTVKVTIPKRLILLAAVPVLLGACVWYMYNSINKRINPEDNPAEVVQPGTTANPFQQGSRAGVAVLDYDPIADARKYVYMNTPRVEGLSHTAPKYDALTVPQEVPQPVACVQTAKRCTCYSQQGTIMDVTMAQCGDFVQRGYFVEFGLPRDRDMMTTQQQNPPSTDKATSLQTLAKTL